MLKTIYISVLAILMVTVIEVLPSQSENIHIGREVENRQLIEKIPIKEYKEIALYEPKPIYCSDYISQYDWNHTVAYNVMMIESSNNARNLNDNPYTGDYSVGCFQINLLGGNQKAKYELAKRLGYAGGNTRDELKNWLWNPSNNTKLAYEMYKKSKWQPWSFTTCKKTTCY